jgi:DNA-binding response OmpR family regulator
MKKILLVEDDEFLKQLYVDLLTKEKYAVTPVVEGNDAYKHIKSGGWDLILLDVMLPGMTGFEILAKLKKEKVKYSKLIFMTNLDSTDKDKALLKEADDYWIKSNIAPPEFIEKVKNALT